MTRVRTPEQVARGRERSRAWYLANKERHKEHVHRHYEANKERVLEQARERYRLKGNITHGLTRAERGALLLSQGGRCANAACRADITGPRQSHIDHDHSHCPGTFGCKECVRGMLCPKCNLCLRDALDQKERLLGLVAYLEGVKCNSSQ